MAATPFPSAAPPLRLSRTFQALLVGLIFVVALLLALITLPPLANGRAEALRQHLNTDVQAFASALTDTENSLQEMQASTRGYVLTQNQAFLEQYRAAEDALPARLQDLTRLAPLVDPTLPDQIADLAAVVARWQRERGDIQISLVQQGRTAEAVAVIAGDESQVLFGSFRTRINDLQGQTQRTQAAVQEQINRARALQNALTSGLAVLGLVAVGFVVAGFRRMLALMRALQTERERTGQLARAAQTERQRLQAVFDHSPEGIVFASAPHGQLSLLNPAAQALLGDVPPTAHLREQAWVGRIYRPGGERCPPDELPLLRSVERGEACRSVELIVEQPDGQRVPVLVTSAPLHAEDGSCQGAVAVWQDLRALREVERLKADFVALVSHELRTPLTAILGCVQTLHHDQAAMTARQRELVQIIDEQGARLQELIDNLLNLSQVERGVLPLRRARVEPLPLIQGVLRQLRDQLSGWRVQTDLAPGLPPVSADARRVEQVLFNLLDNARKFAPPQSVITVSAAPRGPMVVFGVRDQGPGVPEAERQRVFERFYQVEQPATRHVGGSGLGLAICKAIVEAHGGQIEITEAAGGGALATFTLPAMPPSEQPAARPPAGPPAAEQPQVLVVDDDPALRRMLEASLPAQGYRVQTVLESQAALEAAVQQQPDLILLDVMLPGMDGFALCRQLREWTQVPIIMLTARASERDIIAGLQQGADDYLTKPFRINELTARMAAVLRRAQPPALSDGPTLIQVGGLAVDLARRAVTVGGQAVELTPTEYRLLAELARHAGQVLTRQQLLEAVWGAGYQGEHQYLWVHIAHLRQKIEPDSKQPRYVLTARGVGYRLAKE